MLFKRLAEGVSACISHIGGDRGNAFARKQAAQRMAHKALLQVLHGGHVIARAKGSRNMLTAISKRFTDSLHRTDGVFMLI